MESRSSLVLTLTLGCILAVALPARATIFVEDFNAGTVDSDYLVHSSTAGYQSIIQQETLLVQKFPGASGVGRASLSSTFEILGDFSVTTSVDPTLLSGDPILALGVAVASEAGFANIFFKGGGSTKPVFANLFIGPGFPATGTVLPSVVRLFRIRRIGSTLALQYHDGASFQTLNSATHPDLTGPLAVELFLLTEGGSNTAGSIGRFDDLVIEADGFSIEVPGPPTPSIKLGSISAFAGETATLDVVLRTAGASLAGFQNRILLPPGVSIASKANGGPDCRVNPSIDKSATVFSFGPPGCSGTNCTTVLALVLSTSNVDEVADGAQVYSCRLQIPASTPPGPLTLGCTNQLGSTPDGASVAMDCNSATLVVADPTLASVSLNSPTALPGAEVAIHAIFDNGGSVSVGGLDLEFSLPVGVAVLPNSNGGPDCTLEPGVGTAFAGFAHRPAGCSPGGICTGVKVVAGNFLPIPDGRLFTCRAMVDIEAPAGSSPLGCSLDLSDPVGNEFPGNCLNGRMTIADPDLPRLVIGNAYGNSGGEVVVDIALETRGASVATAQGDLLFTPGVSVAALAGGSPDCELSPGLDKLSLFTFQPFGCVPGVNCLGVRLLAVDTVPPITAMPDLPRLFRCRLALAEDLAPGGYPLDCEGHELGTPQGDAIESRCTSGRVQVEEALPCPGDCNGDGAVTAGDITRITATILQCDCYAPGCAEVPGGCVAADLDGDSCIGASELERAILINLGDPDSCQAGPTPTPVPGTVLCGDGVVAGGEECDDGNNYGGDGCAANCTAEQDLTLDISTGESLTLLQSALFSIQLAIAGAEVITVGLPRAEAVLGADGKTTFAPGEMPTAHLLAKNDRIEPIAIPGLACICPRGVVLQTCGGVVPTPGETSHICNTGTLGAINPAVCNGQEPCAPVFGPGAIAGGRIGCDGISDLNYDLDTDSLTGETSFGRSGGEGQTGMLSIGYSAYGLIQDFGSCATEGTTPGKGPDGVPCTDDDLPSTRGVAEVRVQTTGIAKASVLNANDQSGNHIGEQSLCGGSPCSTAAFGTAATCSDLLDHDAFLCLATAFTALEQSAIGDLVFTTRMCGFVQ